MPDTGTATVLFTDLVGSTELRAEVGDERADDVRRALDRAHADVVVSRGGVVVKGLGDGLMASFGTAADAVAAAIAVQQSTHAYKRTTLDIDIAVRVGVSSGDVVWEDGDCFGAPVIEAARLCSAASGGQILVADVVRLLARAREGIEYAAVGEIALKGLPTPVAASEVIWYPASTGSIPFPDLLQRAGLYRFAGRERELENGLQIWKQALGGECQTVLLAGEPGIGKTRLAREVALVAHAEGAVVLYGRCEEDLGAPYQPFVECLDFFVDKGAPGATALGRYGGELARICPVIGATVPDLEPPLRSDAETERYRLFEAVSSWLSVTAEPTGLVLVLDDLHWATKPTLLLLQHVLNSAASARLLIIATYRDTDLDRAHPLAALLADLRRTPGVTRVPLSGLDRDGVAAFLTAAAGHELDDAGWELATELHAETEGNPFFVGEIMRHLAETGVIYQRDGRWVSDRTVRELGIPEGIREVVGRRLDRLSKSTNEALAVAAVIGRDFDVDTLVAAGGLDEDTVLQGLDEAVLARLAQETGVGRFRFSHALVRDTLYGELSATRRSRLHARIAHEIERSRPDDVATLAHHYAAAGNDPRKALDYARLAGDCAMAQLAHDEAVHLYGHAIEQLEMFGDDPLVRCELLIALGEAQRRAGDAGHRETLLTAARLARDVDATDLLVRAALANSRGFWSMVGEIDPERIDILESALASVPAADTAQRAQLLVTLANELMFSVENDRRYQLSRQAVEVARRVGDVNVLVDVLSAASAANFEPWALAEVGLAYAEELMVVAEQCDDPVRQAQAGLWCYSAHGAVGNPQPGVAAFQRSCQLAEELGQPTLRWLTTTWTAFCYMLDGDLDQAEATANLAFEIGVGAGQPDTLTWYAGQLFNIRLYQDRIGELVEMIETQGRENPGLPVWRIVLAVAYARTGRLAEAKPILDEFAVDRFASVPRDLLWMCGIGQLAEISAAFVDQASMPVLYDLLLPHRSYAVHAGVSYLGNAEHYLALLAEGMGRVEDAAQHFALAHEAHERATSPLWQARSDTDWARFLLRRGQPGDVERAHELLAGATEFARRRNVPFITRLAAEALQAAT